LTPERAEELLAQAGNEHELGVDPETGHAIALRAGRYGPYVTELLDGDEKPRTASLFKSMSPESVTLEDALRLLTLPRTLGEFESEEVVAANGRYGPYVKKGKESRSLDSEEQLFSITLDEALAKLAEPKQRGRRAAAPPLKELGDDPVSGKPIVLKEGRFGPYVTDGETNASLRASDSVEEIAPERAAELLQNRREQGPAKKKRTTRKRS
jgi:DNA topoisomerase-1